MPCPSRTALISLALGLALGLPAPLAAAAQQQPTEDRGALDAPPDAPAPTYPWADGSRLDPAPLLVPSEPQGRAPSGVAGKLAGWVAATDDNRALPFLIVDKLAARIFAFDASGQFLGSAPVLVGLARGDDSAPGIGKLKLSQISDDQRTTPAGRFVASFGNSVHGTMLWVDLPDSISLHPVMSVNAGEHRLRRIQSADPSEHRISYGCINVPKAFYDGVVLPALDGGSAVVYVLPDTKTVEDVFPAFGAALDGGREQQVSSADVLAYAPLGVGDPAR